VIALCGLVALGSAAWMWRHRQPAEPAAVSIRPFSVPLGRLREPLPYRIVSFHRGRADKNLIKLASQLGFNGVQFQIEGSNVDGLIDFAQRDAREHLVDYCHSLGMQVTVWVHELSDLPDPWMPEYLGEVSLNNQKMWAAIEDRYEWILSKAIPNVDGLVLTVVETQVKATSTPMMLRIVDLVNKKCQEHHKSLMVRTFVWHPEDLAEVMTAVDQLPSDMVIMSKAVPQDWQMRGDNAAEIGAVGGRPQIEEYDVAGEYFLKGNVANCMVDLLKKQFDYGMSKKIQGICVRVDRDDFNVLFQPQEVNLWALGLLAGGVTDSGDDIWSRWAEYRYGEKAAPGVIRALKPTSEVVAELLSVGPFTDGDTRQFPPSPAEDLLNKNWQNWRWNHQYDAARASADAGDPKFIAEVARQKEQAAKLADQCLADLQQVKGDLSAREYQILYTKLLSNKVQLQFRTPMAMAALHLRQWRAAPTDAAASAVLELYKKDVFAVRAVADAVSAYPAPEEFDYLGRHWEVDAPLGVTRGQLYRWAYDARRLLNYYW
jgi:hypothetical protein